MLSALQLSEPFELVIDGQAHTFGRAPAWCGALPYEQVGPARPEDERHYVALVAWEPGDLRCADDNLSQWGFYDLRHGNLGPHPDATTSAHDVAGIADLEAEASSLLGHPVTLHPDVIEYRTDEGAYSYPAFAIAMK